MPSGSRNDNPAAVILAAGVGTRLRPLTTILPKALCPINNVPLVDLALERAQGVTEHIAVNIHYGRDLMQEHLAGRAHLSIEAPEPLGTAGALAKLRDWIGGRDVLVLNADSWHPQPLTDFVRSSDRERIRLMTVTDPARGDFGSQRYCGAALMPWDEVESLEVVPSGLYDTSWEPAMRDGNLDLVSSDAPFFDCGTISDYHAANMTASGGENVIGPGATVDGEIARTVLWSGVHVGPEERLVDAVRARDDLTVFATLTTVSDGV